MRHIQPGSLSSWAPESTLCLEHEFELPLQIHVPECVIQSLVANNFVIFHAGAAAGFGIEVFNTRVLLS